MTMLTSLKALLFTTPMPKGVQADAMPIDGGTDFAQLLNSVGSVPTVAAQTDMTPSIVADTPQASEETVEYQSLDGKAWHPFVAHATPSAPAAEPLPKTEKSHLPVQLPVSPTEPEEAHAPGGAASGPRPFAGTDAPLVLVPIEGETPTDISSPGPDIASLERPADVAISVPAPSTTPVTLATAAEEPVVAAPAPFRAHVVAPTDAVAPSLPTDMADTQEDAAAPSSDEATPVAQADGQSQALPTVMAMAPPATVVAPFVAQAEQATPEQAQTKQVKPGTSGVPSVAAPTRIIAADLPADQLAPVPDAMRPASQPAPATPMPIGDPVSAAPLAPQAAASSVAAAAPDTKAIPVPTVVQHDAAPMLPDEAPIAATDHPVTAPAPDAMRPTRPPAPATEAPTDDPASVAPLVPQAAASSVAAAPETKATPVPTVIPHDVAPMLRDEAPIAATDHPVTAPAPATAMPIPGPASATPLVAQTTESLAAPAAPDMAASPIKAVDPEGVAPAPPAEAPIVAAGLPAIVPDALRASSQPKPATPVPTDSRVSVAPLIQQVAPPPVAAVTAPTPEIPSVPSLAQATPDSVEALDLPVDLAQSLGPTAPAKPRAEAVSLLQLVRDHMSLRAPRRSETVAPTREVAPDAASVILPTAMSDNGPSLAPLVQPTVQPLAATAPSIPTVDLSASLGAQVVDMGVSGQWIDGLARDIAGLSANGAQGRFQINADQLGPIQVDIRQGEDGATISLTVATEAAEQALRQEGDRLKLDAGLSAMRISEMKIERAPHVAETARADSSGNQTTSQQQSGGQGQNQAQNQGQSMGQGAGQGMAQSHMQGRGQQRENIALGHKAGSDAAVLNHTDVGESAGGAVRARYA